MIIQRENAVYSVVIKPKARARQQVRLCNKHRAKHQGRGVFLRRPSKRSKRNCLWHRLRRKQKENKKKSRGCEASEARPAELGHAVDQEEKDRKRGGKLLLSGLPCACFLCAVATQLEAALRLSLCLLSLPGADNDSLCCE